MSLANDIERLNPQQAAILKGFKKPSLIVAGPGTGKTRTVSVLIGDLLNKGTKLKEILALTFSSKAAQELRTRVLEYYPHSFDECWISTFHSFCARILREQYHLLGIAPDFKLLTGFKEALLIAGICKEQQPEAFSEFGKVLQMRGFQQEILTFISLLKSNLVSVEDFENIINTQNHFSSRSSKRLHEICNLYKLYEIERTKTGYLDFRDLISLSIKVLQHENTADIYRDKFKVILIDEFQDTDPAQFLLLTLLKGDGADGKVAVIGDPRQSIYRFRGANPEMMDRKGPFKKKYKAKIFPLQMNYRCSKQVLEAAKKLHWLDKDENNDEEIIAMSKLEGFVSLYRAKDELDEAKLIARKIALLLIYGKDEKQYKSEDIAILVRNNYQIDLITEALRTLKIPFQIAGDMKFFKSEEVIAIVSLLKVATLEDTERDDALARAFSSKLFEIDSIWVQAVFSLFSPTFTMSSFLEQVSENQFDELPETTEENKVKAIAFAEAINILQSSVDSPLNIVFARLLLIAGKVLKNPEQEEARNILHLRNMMADYCEIFEQQNGREPNASDITDEFEEWLTYYASTLEQEQGTGQGGVKIMTIHQSKGLEFPIVAVCGLCEGLFPTALRENLMVSSNDLLQIKKLSDQLDRDIPFFNPFSPTYELHVEEERRLFYVALTRAEEGVIMSYPQRVGTDAMMPAPFLYEIGIKAEEAEADTRPLTISELRTKIATLPEVKLEEIRPLVDSISKELIEKDLSYYGLWPRNFKPGEIDEVELPEGFVFSASSIKNYVDCPRKFLFQNLLKIKDSVSSNQSHLHFGNAVHQCLEKLHDPSNVWEKGKYPNEEDIEKLIEENAASFLESIEYFERQEKLTKIKEAFPQYCNAIYDLEQIPPRGTIGVEKGFFFDFRGFKCAGRIDRLLNYNGFVAVVDYKSSTTAKSSEKLAALAFPEEGFPNEIQIPFYLLACKNNGYSAATAILMYPMSDPYKRGSKGLLSGFLRASALNLGCGPEWGFDVTNDQFAVFEDKLEAILTKITSDRIFDCKPSPHPEARSCLSPSHNGSKCDYTSFCQERLAELKVNSL